ncbi:MAG: hypothetical protein H6835_14395 [Planctomycetes bacterium]|nr:hypothetical protein [Planctomycetota bacterium]
MHILQGTVRDHGEWRIGLMNAFVRDGVQQARLAIARSDGPADERSELIGLGDIVAIGPERFVVQTIEVGEGAVRGSVGLARVSPP